MSRTARIKAACAGLVISAVLTTFLVVNREAISLRPWNARDAVELPAYADGNNNRTAAITDSEKTVVVLNRGREMIYRIRSDLRNEEKFSSAKFVALDDENNLYVLDAIFGGVLEENVERVLKYSDKGIYEGVVYEYRYINENFILTKGKIAGMSFYAGELYFLRMGQDGFWLDSVDAGGGKEPQSVFFDYPYAFRDLVYGHVNAETRRITLATMAGSIKQFNFDGDLVYDWRAAATEKVMAWTAVSDNAGDIIYTDILNSRIMRISTADGRQTPVYTVSEEERSYYRINYSRGMFYAASDENILVSDGGQTHEIISSYTYKPSVIHFRIAVCAAAILDAVLLMAMLILLILSGSKKGLRQSLKTILLTVACVAFEAAIASLLIINATNTQYNEKMFQDLENISRLITTVVDPDMLSSISSPADYDNEEYLHFKESLTALFTKLQFQGDRVYQIIWTVDNDFIYSLYDLESSSGVYYPFDVYSDGPYKDAYESKEYVYVAGAVTSEGSWLFVCGPILDKNGDVIALIETGYDMRTIQAERRNMIIQTSLVVVATTVAFLLIIIEFIIIFTAYIKSKVEVEKKAPPLNPARVPVLIALAVESYKKQLAKSDKTFSADRLKPLVFFTAEAYKKKVNDAETPPFHPELLRAITFFLFIVNNLEAALLPIYSSKLYIPFLNFPKEFVVTLPIIADMASAALALLTIPAILERFGLKRVSLTSAVFIFIGNALCFVATNTLYLAVAHIFTGFAGGAFLLVINTIIGEQKDVKDVSAGFAHFNASYLAGVNVGVVLGSIIAQFFQYRTVYLFSSMLALVLLGITQFSIRSKALRHIYEIKPRQDKRKKALVGFLAQPIVVVTLVLLILPYVISLSFTSYFMPVYGSENGLSESNIGQLILLNGLLAILFGTSLCEYVAKKVPIKVIIGFSLVLNAAAIYLFSQNMSISMLVTVIAILAIANIFALTNIQTYYATLYQGTRVSSSKALGIYSAVENAAMATGPVVFSYIAAENAPQRMKLVAVILLSCLILFLVTSSIFKKR
jgi:predicted MFS family arabinose efflux permease